MTGGGVIGIGVDLVEIERMHSALERWGPRFQERIFGPEERRYCESRPAPWRHYAARFALKEAVGKAFGTGIGAEIGWLDIETVRAKTGAPSVALSGRAAALAARRGVARVLASLAHGRAYAIAQAVLVGKEPRYP